MTRAFQARNPGSSPGRRIASYRKEVKLADAGIPERSNGHGSRSHSLER